MRSIFFMSFFLFALVIAARAPFIAGLLYVWVDLLAPQRVAYGFIENIQLALISGVASVLFYLMFDRKERIHLGIQWICLILLFVWVTINTMTVALLPDYAWPKWESAYKTILFAAFMPFMFRTRVRLEALVMTIVACVGVVAFSLALKTALGGGVYGSTQIWGGVNATVLGESSTFAMAAASIIPFIAVLSRHSLLLPAGKFRTWLAYGGIAFLLVAIIGSYARTGLICVAVLAVFALRQSRNKLGFIIVALVIGAVSVPLLPKTWVSRMNTLQTANTESSASSRVAVWMWTWDFVKEHPLGGGFENHRLNKIEVTVQDSSRPNDPTAIAKVTMTARAYHSIYFEALGEQGWPGFLLLTTALILSLTKSFGVWRANRNVEGREWLGGLAGANFVSCILLMVGGAFIGIAFSALTYYPIVISLVLVNLHRNALKPEAMRAAGGFPTASGWSYATARDRLA